ncbi:Ingression protein fic1 [Pleurostoma richardsiae]|uniref:Ingression protein fic1 n=1 Tax=Pleurostoma richardsiae TaxID=41990 RepID=A0AA38RAY7_9PEZI|nr:Ingression protein fic1 [Pleurostoma richardsiae]
MSTRLKPHALNGMHTAGIFSDMSIDGPEIGTLVIVVDRAKNLPNRKTIGKQDPYCAARLGKEAKKTNTDIRGGQTPRWDQELRFTVHDSPDYYQLKVSVFNDDKKTDLIGEAWVDLRDIIVPGGGQNDLWHSLTCKGKYAGDIRIEITFYDSRPKPDKPVTKPRPGLADYDAIPPPSTAVPQQRSTPKRRPLPSDPVLGHPPGPAAAPTSATASPQVSVLPSHAPGHAAQNHIQTPPRSQPNPPAAYIPNQSPLQAVEYNTPPASRYHQPVNHSPAPSSSSNYGTQLSRSDISAQPHRSIERHDKYAAHDPDGREYGDYYGQTPERHEPRSPYVAVPEQHAVSPGDGSRWAAPEEDRPPPPPVHRSRNNSGSTQEMAMYRVAYDMTTQNITPPIMRKDVLRNEAHRHSAPSNSYPGKPTYRAYDPATSPSAGIYADEERHQPSPPRHHSYDSAYDPHYRSMQPTVEDAPESPSPMDPYRRRSGSGMPQYDEADLGMVPSPAPLNLGGRGSAASGQYSPSPVGASHRQQDTYDYALSPPNMASKDHPHPIASKSAYGSYSQSSQRYALQRSELDGVQIENTARYALPAPPPVPASLVPGIDADLSQEIASRINDDRRQERRYTQPAVATPPRGRQTMIERPPGYSSGPPNSSPQPVTTPQQNYKRSPITYSGGPPPQVMKPRAISPSPSPTAQHTIRRKSISPAPETDSRRLSGIPFGPDSYDALNPTLASSASKEASRSDYIEVNGKIITHDGKEVDPSDHLPMDTWAPEPEPKQSKPVAQSSIPRVSPGGAQPMPSSGRRTLRIAAARPQSTQALPPPTYMSSDAMDQSTPSSSGRNRLQKKANRASAVPVMSGALGGSSPLAPLAQHQDNYTPPRHMTRARTFEYPSENHAPLYGSSPGTRGNSASAPPVPAKVPIMSGAMMPAGGTHGGGEGEWTLLEEMSKIDIGTGRARRHGYRGQ